MVKISDMVAYDLRETSGKLKASERTLRQYIRDGKLQAFKLGLKYFVTQKALESYFDTPSRHWEK